MTKIQVFEYQSNKVRTVDMDGAPWFVLKDVCEVLGLGNSRMVSDRLDEDEKGVSKIDTLGGVQNVTIINESGLYNVILRSDKPEAKPFRKWVTSEVLPSIRKTGSYTMPKLSKEMQALFLLDDRTQKQEARLTALENTMTVDYSQQQTLKKAVAGWWWKPWVARRPRRTLTPMCAASCSASATATFRTGSGSTACATYPARISPRLWSTSSAGSPAPTP